MSRASRVVILGIDPGYERCGVAVLEKAESEALKYSTCLQTSTKLPHPERLLAIGTEVESLITAWRPTHLALEKLFVTTNQETAMQVGEVRGVLLYLAAKHQLTVAEFSPPEIKQTVTGHGSADKQQIAAMVRRLVTLLHEPKYDDEFDAIAVALTTAARLSTLG